MTSFEKRVLNASGKNYFKKDTKQKTLSELEKYVEDTYKKASPEHKAMLAKLGSNAAIARNLHAEWNPDAARIRPPKGVESPAESSTSTTALTALGIDAETLKLLVAELAGKLNGGEVTSSRTTKPAAARKSSSKPVAEDSEDSEDVDDGFDTDFREAAGLTSIRSTTKSKSLADLTVYVEGHFKKADAETLKRLKKLGTPETISAKLHALWTRGNK